MRVNFMIIGAQKCGTTSLASQLAEHPEICFCRIKEPAYFHKVQEWQVGLDDYHRLYSPRDGQICGEASTMYTFLPEWQETHSRLFAYNPELKLIYIMRQPVERVISNYSHDLVRGLVKAPPEVGVLKDPGYVNRSRYAVQIRPYLKLFRRENVLLLIFEEYVCDQAQTLQEIAGFLGISAEPFGRMEAAAKNKAVGELHWKYSTISGLVHSKGFDLARTYLPNSVRKPIRHLLSNRLEERPEFSPTLRQTLWWLLEDDVQGIEALLGRRLDQWRAGSF